MRCEWWWWGWVWVKGEVKRTGVRVRWEVKVGFRVNRRVWGDKSCGGENWGQAVTLPPSLDEGSLGRDNRKPVSEWARMGVRPLEGVWDAPGDRPGAIVVPSGGEGAAFMVHQHWEDQEIIFDLFDPVGNL